MSYKKFILTLLLNAFCVTPAALAMCTRTTAVKNTLSRAASARFSTVKPPVARASRVTPQATQKMMLKRQFSSSSDDKKHSHQGSWQQAEAKDAIKKALGITAPAAIAAIILEAGEIADFARKTFFMDTLDEGLISDEFSRAIVKIYDESGGQCSGCIIASEKYLGVYFVLTAAHCVSHEGKDYIHIKHPQYSDDSDKDIKIELAQILIEPSTDVAIFLIPSQEKRRFQDETGTVLPAIPAKQLSSIEPRKNEVILLQGYPARVPFKNFYREKFMSKGPTASSYTGGEETLTKLVPLEKHLPETLHGASGAPYIVIRDNSPEVQGIHSGGVFYTFGKVRAGPTYGAGFGKLPHYLQQAEDYAQEAEKRAHEQQEAEKEALQKTERKKSLLRRLSEGYFR